MITPHTIEARNLAEWIDDELNEMRPYASSSTEDKRLLVSLTGRAIVYHGQTVVYTSRDLAHAVEIYNKIASMPGSQPPVNEESSGADPVRTRYRHVKPDGGCTIVTRMTIEEGRRFAHDRPSTLFCVGCAAHAPVSEFVWEGTDSRVE